MRTDADSLLIPPQDSGCADGAVTAGARVASLEVRGVCFRCPMSRSSN